MDYFDFEIYDVEHKDKYGDQTEDPTKALVVVLKENNFPSSNFSMKIDFSTLEYGNESSMSNEINGINFSIGVFKIEINTTNNKRFYASVWSQSTGDYTSYKADKVIGSVFQLNIPEEYLMEDDMGKYFLFNHENYEGLKSYVLQDYQGNVNKDISGLEYLNRLSSLINQ